PSLDDGRTDLLVAAERSAEKSGDVETELLTEDRAGRSCRVQLMLRQGPAIEARPRQQLHLAVVVSDQRQAFARRHRNHTIGHRRPPSDNWRRFQDYSSCVAIMARA